MIFWLLFISVMFLSFAPVNFGGIRYTKLRRNIGIITLIFITIFRYDVGYDYSGYFYNMYPFFDYESYERLEPIGKFFMNISFSLGSPIFFFIFYGLITLTNFTFAFIKLSKSIFLSFLFYLAFFYLPGLSTIRQEAAVSLVLLGLIFINQKRPFYYIALCILASMFHTSAIIAVPFYFFLRIKNKNLLITITIAIIGLSSLLMNIILNIPTLAMYYHYIEGSDDMKGGALMRFLYIGISLVLFLISYRKSNITILRLALLSLIGSCMTMILGGHLGGRIAEYFTIFLCIGVPNICIESYKKYVMPIGCSLVFLFIANIYVSTKNPTKSPYTPYQSVLFVDTKNPKFK